MVNNFKNDLKNESIADIQEGSGSKKIVKLEQEGNVNNGDLDGNKIKYINSNGNNGGKKKKEGCLKNILFS